MPKEFQQIAWDERLESDWKKLLTLAVAEDLGTAGDWTSRALVPEGAVGAAAVVARGHGIAAGLPGVPAILAVLGRGLRWTPEIDDGRPVERGQRLGRLDGPARGLLAAERLLLNFLGRLCGIATLTRRYVDAVAGTKARIYDTRKTTPGWRRLEKYAVRCGGGWNHRTGLDEAVLIKDNHLALGAGLAGGGFSPGEAVTRARSYLESNAPNAGKMIVEIEVDSLDQFDEALAAGPDLVLLDNMGPAELREAVTRRNRRAPGIDLEASGGVNLETVRGSAETGVDRISVGALTHGAASLDVALDWLA